MGTMQIRWGVARALALTLAVGSAACSSTEPMRPSSGSAGSFRERMSALLFRSGSSEAPGRSGPAATTGAASVSCPPLDIRQGAATLMSNAGGADASVTTLRYQATIGDMARECSVRGPNLNIKVGVHGRIILGPAGVPGTVELPLRLALVREGGEPKTLWTKLYRIPVTIASGQPHAPFLHIEEDLTVPMPSGDEADAYVIYIGFDPLGLREQPKRPQKRRSS